MELTVPISLATVNRKLSGQQEADGTLQALCPSCGKYSLRFGASDECTVWISCEECRLVNKSALLAVLSLTPADVSIMPLRDSTRYSQAVSTQRRTKTPLAKEMPLQSQTEASCFVRLSDVQSEEVSWLWKGRIPFGKLTLIDGDPGLGKSTLALDIAARVSRGETMPDTPANVSRGNVLLLTCEDGLADTIRPRLEAAGADVSRVIALSNVSDEKGLIRPPVLPDDVGLIEEIVKREGISLVIIDPFMAYLSASLSSRDDQSVRRALMPLASVAEETGAAFLLLRHLNKMQGGTALYRGGGSIGIIGAARVGLLVAKHPEDENRRILAVSKNNLAPIADALEFHLDANEGESVASIRWDGISDFTADRLLASPAVNTEPSAIESACTFLREILADEGAKASELKSMAEHAGISWASVRRAKERLGVVSKSIGSPKQGGYWEWRLPNKDIPEMPEQEGDNQ